MSNDIDGRRESLDSRTDRAWALGRNSPRGGALVSARRRAVAARRRYLRRIRHAAGLRPAPASTPNAVLLARRPGACGLA
jgi:hypothetical protein